MEHAHNTYEYPNCFRPPECSTFDDLDPSFCRPSEGQTLHKSTDHIGLGQGMQISFVTFKFIILIHIASLKYTYPVNGALGIERSVPTAWYVLQ